MDYNDNINIEKDFEQIEQEDENDLNENELMNNQYNNNNNYVNNNVDINELKDLSEHNNNNMNINNQEYQNVEEEEYNDNEMINENDNIEYQNQNINDNNNDNNDINDNNEEILQEDDHNFINNLDIDESLKAYIFDLHDKLISLSNENEQLKMAGSQLIDNNKNIMNLQKQNNFLIEKIKELQMKNKKLGQELLKTKNKYKNQNNINNNSNNNNRNPNNIESKTEIIKLNSKINEYEIIISKLNLEKKILDSTIENLKKDHENEIKLMTHYKNNELQSYKKIINDFSFTCKNS